MKLCVVLSLLVLLASLTLTGAAWGQAQNTGSIFGSVVDTSGAVVPNAQVTVTNPEKGFTRTVTSSKSGDYNLPSLPVGMYTVTVAAATFQTFVSDGVTVDADKSVKIVAKMVIGDAKETVQVDAEGTTLDTKSPTLGTLIDNKLVEDLPIDGRNVVAMAGLLPGVTDLNAPGTSTNDRQGPTYSVSGSRNTQNLFLFDGLMWNNLFFNTGINYPPPNALQEISVLLNNFKAQYGRNAGSVFNVVTKSGSNKIHGAVWDYFQNQALNAADYITKRNPKDISNQMGFTVNGPILRDKLYYALTFQDLIQHLQVVGISPTQNEAERGFLPGTYPAMGAFKSPTTAIPYNRPCTNGAAIGYPAGETCASFIDLVTTIGSDGKPKYAKFLNPEILSSTSGLQAQGSDAIANFNAASLQAGGPADSPCNALLNQAANYSATHPYLDGSLQGTYLPYAEVPTPCLNPVVSRFLNTFVGLPDTLLANGSLANISVSPQPRNDRNALARVDWVFNTRHTIDARYNLIDADDATAPGVTNQSLGIATFALNANHAVSNYGNIGDTWVVTPNIVNVARIGYKRYVFVNLPTDNRTWNDFGGNFVEPGIPTLPSLNFSNEFRLGAATQGTASQGYGNVINENIEVLEQLSWVHGSHNYQFGGNFLGLQYSNRADYPGSINFSSTYSGYSFADAAFGLPTSVQANSKFVQAGISHAIFGYAQDDWRATPKLTVNLGVRYELPFQWYQPTGYSSTFLPGHQSTVFPGAIGGLAFPGDNGVLKSLVPTDFNGLVPRVGFAYDVFGDGKLAIRAGFGMFFDAVNANVVGVGEPFYYQFFKNLPPGGASVPLARYGTNFADTAANGNVLKVPDGFDRTNPQFVAPYVLFYPDRNFRTPYYEAMNVGFQYHVNRSGVLDINFVGKLGRKQTIPFDQNPAISQCSGGYYDANPTVYASPYCTLLNPVPGQKNGQASSQTASTQARLRYTPFNFGGNGLVDFASIGTSNYNGLQAQYTQRGGKYLTLLMSYAYAKAIDLQTDSTNLQNQVPNVFDVSSQRSVSDFDSRHVLNMGWTVNLPRVRGGNAIKRGVLDGWIYSGQFNAHTGRPFNFTINNDSALSAEPNQRPMLRPGFSPYLPKSRHRTDKAAEYFNVDAFTYPTIGSYSTLPRNFMYGPGYLLTNMTLGRTFPLSSVREGMRLTMRAEAFNVFNTPNLANPRAQFSCSSTSIQTPGNANFGMGCRDLVTSGATTSPIGSLNTTFGQIGSTFGNNGNTSTNGRKMQISATVYF